MHSYYSGLVGKMQSIADFSRKLLHLCRRAEHAAQEADALQQGLFAFDKLRVRFENHRAVEAILAQDARKLLPVKHAAPRQAQFAIRRPVQHMQVAHMSTHGAQHVEGSTPA